MCKWKILYRYQTGFSSTWHVEYVDAMNIFNALDKFAADHIGENVFVEEVVKI